MNRYPGADLKAQQRSDQFLWDSALAGDAESFGDLFVRHQAAVYTYCFRRTSSWSIAEDLTSTVFLEVWRTRRTLDLSGTTLLPWLIGVATRVTGRHQRSQARHERLLGLLTGRRDPDQPTLAETVAQTVDDERRMAEVLAAVRTLATPDQDVIAVCVFAELNYADAAVALGVPVGTVKSRLSRARRRLGTAYRSCAPPGPAAPPDQLPRRHHEARHHEAGQNEEGTS